jgi:hypothetical protein
LRHGCAADHADGQNGCLGDGLDLRMDGFHVCLQMVFEKTMAGDEMYLSLVFMDYLKVTPLFTFI